MTPQELNAAVARVADTPGTNITAPEVARVIACTFDEFVRLPPEEGARLYADCLARARARMRDAAFSDAPPGGLSPC